MAEKYHSIGDNAVEGIYQSTPEGEILAVNPALARLLGYDSPEELIASCIEMEEQYYVDPDTRTLFKRLLEEREIVYGLEYQAYRRDGSRIWVLENARAVRDETGHLLYYEGSIEEITERKRAEEAVQEANQRTIIEYEEMVRDIASQALEENGYRVLAATDAVHAQSLCQEHEGRIHLMLTDVVMPQMSGRTLAERVATIRPEMRILYMSGYTDDHIVHHGVLEEGMNFIEKPFTADRLARKVREVLNGSMKDSTI